MQAIPDKDDLRVFSGFFMVVSATIFLATLGIIAKYSFNAGATALELLFWRTLICVLIFWIISFIKIKDSRINKLSRREIILGLLAGVLGHYFTAITGLTGLEYIPAAESGLIYAAYPAFVILIDSALKKKYPEIRKLVTILITIIGIYLIAGSYEPAKLNSKGIILTLISTISCACFIIINQKAKINSLAFVTLTLTGGLIATACHYLFIHGSINPPKFDFVFFCFALSAFFCSFGFLMFSKGIRRIGAGRSAIISNSGPFFAVVFAYLILGEELSAIQLCGGIIILSAIFFMEKRLLVMIKNKKII